MNLETLYWVVILLRGLVPANGVCVCVFESVFIEEPLSVKRMSMPAPDLF